MSTAGKGLEPLNRAVSPQEADLIRWLVEHGDPAFVRLADLIDKLIVVSKCNCGCPTVYFELKGNPLSRKGERLVGDWLAQMDGEPFGVMLFELEGEISSLEVYSCSGSVKEFGLPEIGSLLGYDDRFADRLNHPPSKSSL